MRDLWPSVMECPDCFGFGELGENVECPFCLGTGVLCAECRLTPVDCECEPT